MTKSPINTIRYSIELELYYNSVQLRSPHPKIAFKMRKHSGIFSYVSGSAQGTPSVEEKKAAYEVYAVSIYLYIYIVVPKSALRDRPH